MEVKIQYTINFEDLLFEVTRLIPLDDMKHLGSEGEDLIEHVRSSNPTVALEVIEEVRHTIYCVDRRLADLDAILRGYISIRAGAPTQSSADLEEDKLENLKSLIEEAKQAEGEYSDSVS
jgi:hypothetical protein